MSIADWILCASLSFLAGAAAFFLFAVVESALADRRRGKLDELFRRRPR